MLALILLLFAKNFKIIRTFQQSCTQNFVLNFMSLQDLNFHKIICIKLRLNNKMRTTNSLSN